MARNHLTRRGLLFAAAPLAATPVLASIARQANTEDSGDHHTGHVVAAGAAPGGASGHAAMIGERRPGGRRPARSRRPALPAARAALRARARARVHADRRRPRDRGRARRLLPGLDLQRHRPGPGDPRDRGRPPARPLLQRRLAPAHDPLPRHPPDEHGRRLRGRPAGRAASPTSSTRGRPGSTSTTATRRRSRSTSTRASTARSSSIRRSRGRRRRSS